MPEYPRPETKGDATMNLSPPVTFLIVLVIGVLAA